MNSLLYFNLSFSPSLLFSLPLLHPTVVGLRTDETQRYLWRKWNLDLPEVFPSLVCTWVSWGKEKRRKERKKFCFSNHYHVQPWVFPMWQKLSSRSFKEIQGICFCLFSKIADLVHIPPLGKKTDNSHLITNPKYINIIQLV